MRKIFAFSFVFLCIFICIAENLEGLSIEDVSILEHPFNKKNKRKCELAIGCIFRDEADYLKEWIEYHLLAGVSHFYLYNNLSQDRYLEVLDPYIQSGIVELFDVPFEANDYYDGAATFNFLQVSCYQHAISQASDYNTWLAIIDSDEFICPVVDKSIPKALKRYSYAGGLALYWQIYGTSNVWELEDDELLIEKLLLKAPNNGSHTFFKCIVRPKNAKCMDPHYIVPDKLPLVIPTHQTFSHSRKFDQYPVDIIRINHYHFRTESFYWNQKRKRRQQWGDNPTPEQARERIDYHNSIYDPSILPFVKKLKKRLQKNLN